MNDYRDNDLNGWHNCVKQNAGRFYTRERLAHALWNHSGRLQDGGFNLKNMFEELYRAMEGQPFYTESGWNDLALELISMNVIKEGEVKRVLDTVRHKIRFNENMVKEEELSKK